MNLILIMANIAVVAWLVVLVKRKTANWWANAYWLPLVLAKILAGSIVAAMYIYYYGHGDLLGYVNDASVYRILGPLDFAMALLDSGVSESIKGLINFQEEPRAIIMAKIVAIFHYPAGNVWLTGANISLVGATVIYYFCNLLGLKAHSYRKAILVGFAFFPTLLLWGSGITKEAIIFPAMLMAIIPVWLTILGHQVHLKHWTMAVVGIFIIVILKYYVAAVLIPILFATWLSYALAHRIMLPKLAIWLLALILPILLATQLHPNLYPHRIAQVITENHDLIAQKSSGQSLIHFEGLAPSIWSMLLHFPKAAFTAIYRPLLGEGYALPQMLAGVESTVLLLLSMLLLVLIVFKKSKRPVPFCVLPMLAYALVMAGLLCLSTPNFGTMARYKVLYMPFVVFLIAAGFQWLREDTNHKGNDL